MRAGGHLCPVVLHGIDCDDEVDLLFVLKADANSSSLLSNCQQRANLFPCVLTEDEQLHLQKQFGRVSKLSAQPEMSFTVCVHVHKLCILKVPAFSFLCDLIFVEGGHVQDCKERLQGETASHWPDSFFGCFFFFGRFRGERILSG